MKSAETAKSSQRDERSIYGEILDWMLAPLLFLWPISIAVTHYFSEDIANIPYDQAQRERLGALVASFKRSDDTLPGRWRVALASEPLARVVDAEGRTLAGHGDIPVPALREWSSLRVPHARFRDEMISGRDVRIAYTVLAAEGGDHRSWRLLAIAENREARVQLANKIVVGVIVPQFFLIPLAVFLVWFGLSRGLGPLAHLRETLGSREVNDLSPINIRSVPEELEPLVDSFNAMLRRMKRNVDSQHRFIADAAHQMRTPLTGLKTQAQLAMRENDPQALRHALRQIANSVDRATRLSHQLLTLARTESGEIGPQKHEPVDLDQLLRESIEDWVMRAYEKEIDLGYEAQGETWVHGNAFILRELISNLIDNALRYTPTKGTVTCRVIRNGEFIILEVEDNGIGISLESAELVFERFYRVDDSNSEGSGLGLAIVREIATQHGAYAALRPNPRGRGAVARVVFPAADAFPIATGGADVPTA